MKFEKCSLRLGWQRFTLSFLTVFIAFLVCSSLGCGKSADVEAGLKEDSIPASPKSDSAKDVTSDQAASPAVAATSDSTDSPSTGVSKFRVATFNVSLYRNKSGELIEDLVGGSNDQAHKLAHIIQKVRPDILLLNEFDYDENHEAIAAFAKQYLAVGHDDAAPITFNHFYTNEVNTGVPSGVDLDNDGRSDGWNDCFGFGKHPGMYGMVVFSKFPIDSEGTRTFRKLLWRNMSDANLPTVPSTKMPFYTDEAIEVFRISSKSHWDVVVDVEGTPFHFLVSHPTPPVFDGPEDRNGKRNHDEIRLWADYIANDPGGYIVDDAGKSGGLTPGSHFVIAGDLNADPNDGASFEHAIRQLTEHELVNASRVPSSGGSAEQNDKGVNGEHAGDPAHDTADFDDRRTGNLRADYVLPSKTLKVVDAGVFWPTTDEKDAAVVKATDHRMVWIDVELKD